MNHPKILPSRHGLPPTSNVPWSAADEKDQRFLVLLSFVFFWISIVGGIVFVWALGRDALIPGIFVFGGVAVFFFIRLQRDRRKLYAMLLNKPRATQNLTEWIEHLWKAGQPSTFVFVCKCGLLVDMNVAPFFEATQRWAVICDCGRGHFMIHPMRVRG